MKPKNLCLVAAVMALSMVTGLLTSSGTAHAALATVPHYDCYNSGPVSQPPTLPLYLTLETQFGTHEVSIAPVYADLCLPALKSLDGGQHWEGSLSAAHVECVPIMAGHPAGKIVKLTTQFGVQKNVTVGKPIETCMPATKSLTGPPGTPPTAPHYECYEINGPSPLEPGTAVTVTDQFLPPQGTQVEIGNPTRLCLPAKKNGVGDLTVPHVECFEIKYGPVADRFVYLLTQFGPYQEVHVDNARELCVPVLKEMGVSIGGIAEAPDADASALEATASGGSSTTTYAAIAGIAAVAVLLGAGGWYARRRWLS